MDVLEKMWQFLLDDAIATNEEIELVTDINGYNEDTLRDILYVRTAYRDFDQIDANFYDDEDDDE